MSFEGLFDYWLKTQDKAEDRKTTRGGELEQHLQIVHPAGEIKRVGDEASVPHDALGSKFVKHVPVSSAVNVSSKQLGRQIQATSLSSVQISHSDKDVVQDGQTKDLPYLNDKIKDCLEETNETNKHPIASIVDDKHMKQNMPVEGQDHRQCHTHSVLTSLKDATPTTSPAGVEVLRVDSVLSPEHDSRMEPDSTSECLAASKSISTRKPCEIMHKVYQGRGDSPCSTGGEANNTGIKPSTVTVHVEESQAECDSTCMYLASPNAISPASQGEIEERVCPFLSDHEDGASPAHCVCQCQCRTLPPPVKLLTGDHVPTITTATSASPPSFSSHHLTVRIVSTKTDSGSSEIISKTPLISSKSHYECRTSSDLEQFATKLELRRKKTDEKQQIETVVTTLQGKDVGKHYLSEYAGTNSAVSATPSEEKDFPVINGLLEHSKDETGTSRHERSSGSGKLDVSVKCDPKQNEVCDFAKHIDWDTAVAETFESSTSVRGYDGESKPGIILKIRAKAVVPCLEKNLEPKSVQPAPSGKRKGESLGCPEILSRLRKRQKSEVDTSGTPCSSEQANSEQHPIQCKAKGRLLTSSTGSGGSCRNSSTSKRTRHNTVHLDGELQAYTRHLSPSDCKFVESCTRLSRLQTLTYNLVYSLFPLLRQQLNCITPESHHFTEITNDIISSLECSDSEEIVKDFECLSEQVEKLKVKEADLIPIYSPRVVLCRDPLHSLEDFQHKVCSLLQLLLPDLSVSLSDCFLRTPGQLEEVLRRMLSANKIKDKGARKCRVMSL